MALDEPLPKARAQALVLAILESGRTSISAHALDEMDADGLDGPDILEVLEHGWLESCRREEGSWRYRFTDLVACVVIAFRSEHALVVVTAWRN